MDIGGTNVRAARVDPQGRLTGHIKVPTGSGPTTTDLVRDLVDRLIDDDVLAVGIGIPGRLDRDGASILSAGYVDLAGLQLGELIGTSIGRPVVLDNDAHMALAAELALGAAIDADHVVMFTVGTGIGGAVAASRAVLRGRGNAGQLGHLTLDPGGPECKCGRRGCSEVYTSGTALSRHIREAGLPDGTSAEHLLRAPGPGSRRRGGPAPVGDILATGHRHVRGGARPGPGDPRRRPGSRGRGRATTVLARDIPVVRVSCRRPPAWEMTPVSSGPVCGHSRR